VRSQVEKALGLLRQSEAIEPYVFRPWLDGLSFRTIVDVYFPLSRAWALAEDCGYDSAAFLARLPRPLPSLFESAAVVERGMEWMMASAKEAAERYQAEEASWRKAFFAEKQPEGPVLARRQEARLKAADAYSASRSYFLPLKLLGRAPGLNWNVAPPEEVERRFAPYLDKPETLLDPSDPQPSFELSHGFTDRGRRHRWLRATPGDTPHATLGAIGTGTGEPENKPLWAHIIEPEGAKDPPTLVFLHGIAMETEMWVGFEDAVLLAVDQGFRVIRPEGPWHGRRKLKGHFGGEPVLSWGPLGFLTYITRHLREAGQLIAWARGQGGGPVALMGLSLGGLTSQRLGTAANAWPEAYRPDALMLLVVSGRAGSLEIGGRLARELGIPQKLAESGWSEPNLAPYRLFAEPQEAPPLPPNRLFMLLGKHDELMPIEDGLALAKRWKVPEGNLSVSEQGHFSASLGLSDRPGIYKDFLDKVKSL